MTQYVSSESTLPDGSERVALAKQFYDELSDTFEVFADIAEQHGARTLSDLFHLHAAIMSNGFIDIWPDSEVAEIVAQLPSAERWLEYASVYDEEGIQKKQSIFSKAQEVVVTPERAAEATSRPPQSEQEAEMAKARERVELVLYRRSVQFDEETGENIEFDSHYTAFDRALGGSEAGAAIGTWNDEGSSDAILLEAYRQVVAEDKLEASKGHKPEGETVAEALTPEQQEALDAFRARNGRNWKSALRTSWERARYPSMAPDHAAALQRIRNTLGPEWLAKYRPQELPKAESPDRLEAIKEALQRDGEDPKFLDKVLGTLRAQNVSSLDDQEIDRAFGTVMLAHYCTRYVKAARSHGLTVDDVYLGTTMPRDVSTPADTTPKPESDAGSEHGTVANAALAEERLQALGLDILSNEDVEAWNRAKNLNGALYPDISLHGWLEQDGFLTKEFYVRDPSGDDLGLYRKAWFGDYAGGDEREIIITDHDGNELKAASDSPEP